MDEDFQKEEAMKDILIKNERIKILERENNILMIENKLLKEGLKCSVEAKSYKIAEHCLKELRLALKGESPDNGQQEKHRC